MTTAIVPATEGELAALVRDTAAGEALAIEGNGTKRHLGPAAAAGARRVSLRGLARVTAHEPADMILSVQAGARLADVQRALAAHDQWLPLDPPFADATVGGVLATNATGPRRTGYGTCKDLLLGLRVINARGQLTKSGGRVVKNVSGYDLHRVQVGAFGSLGVIVEAHLRVRARPEASALWAVPCPTLDDAHRFLLDVGASPLEPVALEAVDAAEAARLRWDGAGAGAAATAGAFALVGVEGARASLERHARDLRARATAAGAKAIVFEGAAVDAGWSALRELPVAHADDVRVRVGARPHDLSGLLAALEVDASAARGITVHAAIGTAHVSLAPPDGEGALAALAARVRTWHARAAAAGGYAVVESAPLALPGRATLPFSAAPATGLGAALRRAWDPGDTLNAGRMPT
jgi:glycolate oxidase FAD binding subunit